MYLISQQRCRIGCLYNVKCASAQALAKIFLIFTLKKAVLHRVLELGLVLISKIKEIEETPIGTAKHFRHSQRIPGKR